MKPVIFILFLFGFSLPAFSAVAPDRRICDRDGHCADISASGELMTSSTNEGFTTAANIRGAQDWRISDNAGDVANISSDGTLQTA